MYRAPLLIRDQRNAYSIGKKSKLASLPSAITVCLFLQQLRRFRAADCCRACSSLQRHESAAPGLPARCRVDIGIQRLPRVP
eukprot:5410802-Prymnesium_polylepis.1